MVQFLIGCMVGGSFGIIVYAFCAAAGRADEIMEQEDMHEKGKTDHTV